MLQITKERLDTISIYELYELIVPTLSYRKTMYQRYARKQSPCDTMNNGVEPDGRVKTIIPLEHYIVNMAQGYLGGKAPSYSVPDDDFAEKLERIRLYNDDGATFIELLHDYLITASCYLYVYQDEYGEIRYVKLDPLQTVTLYDYSTPPRPLANIRMWQEADANGGKIDVLEKITASERVVMTKDGYKDIELHQWNDVPVIAFENSDNIAIFEPAITIIDAYEQISNNIKNYTHANDIAKMLIAGYESGCPHDSEKHQETCKEMLKEQVIFVGEGGSVNWLLKNVDYSGLLDVLTRLHQNITMLTGVPNMTDESFSNASSGVALGYKLYALEQYSATADRIFKKGYLRLVELVTSRLNLRGGNYDFRTVDIKFTRNVPNDKGVDTAAVISMKNAALISCETAIDMLPYDFNVADEMDKIKKESEDEYNRTFDRGGANELLDESGQSNENAADVHKEI